MSSQSNFNLHSLNSKTVEHFLRYLLTIFISYFENTVHIHSPFLIGSLIFLSHGFLNSLYIQDINHLSDVYLAKILSHYMGFLFTHLVVSLAVQTLLFYEVPLVKHWPQFLMESIQKGLSSTYILQDTAYVKAPPQES